MSKQNYFRLSVSVFFFTILILPAGVFGSGYDNALKGLSKYDAVYDVSTADPKVANIVFWAVTNSYKAAEVKAIAKPNVAVVFRGAAVSLLTTDTSKFTAEQQPEVLKFHQTLKQMKQDGVHLEVCLYAVEVMGVDKATILPEIDQVANGFVSVIGYQNQGYAVVRLP